MLFWLLALTIPLIVFVLRRANLGFVRREVKLEIVPRTAVTTGNEVLVTGGMGFIGSAVTKALVDRGNCSVRVMDIALPPAEKRDARITYIRGDIGNMEHVKTALNGVHSVFHIAGIIPNLRIPDSECFRVNVHGTRNIVEGCKMLGVRRLLYTSSATVLLDPEKKIQLDMDETTPYPTKHPDVYTTTKEAAERIVLAANSNQLATCVVRPSIVFGVGDKGCSDIYVVGKNIRYIGEGTHLLDWVPIQNVVFGHLCAMDYLGEEGNHIADGQIYHITQGVGTSHRDFAGYAEPGQLNRWHQQPAQPLPVWVAQLVAWLNEKIARTTSFVPFSPLLTMTAIEFTQRSYVFNNEKAKREIGYRTLLSVDEATEQIAQMYHTGTHPLRIAQNPVVVPPTTS